MLNLSRRFLLASAAATALVGCAAPGVAPEVRNALAPTGTLRVAVYPGSPTSLVRGPGQATGPQVNSSSRPPPEGVGSSGRAALTPEMRGLTVEVGRELARRLGVPAEIVVFERVPQIVDALKEGKADFTISNASPARARDIDFTPPVVQLETGYLVRANSGIAALADVDRPGVRVGVAQGSTSQGVLMRDLKQATVVAAASVVAATEMLKKGELDAFATNKAILFDMSDRLPGSRVLDGRWGLEQLAVGVPKGREAAAAYLKAFVADPATQALVLQAAQRAGLRGLAAPDAR